MNKMRKALALAKGRIEMRKAGKEQIKVRGQKGYCSADVGEMDEYLSGVLYGMLSEMARNADGWPEAVSDGRYDCVLSMYGEDERGKAKDWLEKNCDWFEDENWSEEREESREDERVDEWLYESEMIKKWRTILMCIANDFYGYQFDEQEAKVRDLMWPGGKDAMRYAEARKVVQEEAEEKIKRGLKALGIVWSALWI